jgi:hypothetical protein
MNRGMSSSVKVLLKLTRIVFERGSCTVALSLLRRSLRMNEKDVTGKKNLRDEWRPTRLIISSIFGIAPTIASAISARFAVC